MSTLKVCGFVMGGLLIAAVVTYAVILATGSSDQPATTPIGPRAVDSLKFIVVVSRHGNRGSATDYPGDPYPTNNTQYWPYGVDGLTVQGRTQMFELGQKIRSLYSGFIPAFFNSDDILARSTYMDRLMMSGEAFLAGLYPPKGYQVWDSDLDWQPTALYSDSPDNTHILLSIQCNLFESQFGCAVAEVDAKYAKTLSYVSEYVQNATGINTTSYGPDIGFLLWDKMSAEYNEGYKLPEWTRHIYPKLLQPYTEDAYIQTWAGTDAVIRIVIGNMYGQALDAMVQKVNGSLTPDRKVLYYSGHDSSIIALQRIIGVSIDSMVATVRPGSALVMELHQNNDTQPCYLQAVYIDGYQLDHAPLLLNITSDFSNLVNNTQKYLNVDLTTECQQ